MSGRRTDDNAQGYALHHVKMTVVLPLSIPYGTGSNSRQAPHPNQPATFRRLGNTTAHVRVRVRGLIFHFKKRRKEENLNICNCIRM